MDTRKKTRQCSHAHECLECRTELLDLLRSLDQVNERLVQAKDERDIERGNMQDYCDSERQAIQERDTARGMIIVLRQAIEEILHKARPAGYDRGDSGIEEICEQALARSKVI